MDMMSLCTISMLAPHKTKFMSVMTHTQDIVAQMISASELIAMKHLEMAKESIEEKNGVSQILFKQ